MPRAEPPFLDPAAVGADDRGFLLGDGIFETLRVYGWRPFRLDEHLRRLQRGADIVGIRPPRDLLDRVERFLRCALEERGGSGDAALRITLSRGRGGPLQGDARAEPTLALRLQPLEGPAGWGAASAGAASVHSGAGPHEVGAVLEGWLHERGLAAGIKGIGYLERILALRRARERGAGEALFRNSRGEVVEGAFSNLLAVLPGGRLVSPGPESGALPGVTRGVLLEEAERSGMPVEERGLAPAEVRAARELLLASSIREVTAVTEVEGTPVGDGAQGPVARALAAAFREVVARETG